MTKFILNTEMRESDSEKRKRQGKRERASQLKGKRKQGGRNQNLFVLFQNLVPIWQALAPW
jgi:hypothetical protein